MCSTLMMQKCLKSILEKHRLIRSNIGMLVSSLSNHSSVASAERINVAHLQLSYVLPMEYIPDPRTVIEDA